MYRSTRQVAETLGIPPSRINRAIWEGRLNAPLQGPSSAFLWTDEDILRAGWVLLGRDVEDLLEKRGETRTEAEHD